MAKASLSAQHYLECDNCEENPAKFLCKTCTGHLCEACKSKHERKKITRNHEILPLTSKNEEMLDTLLCPKHTKKKLDCYCDRCREPVCTECIVQSHNGHSVKTLFTVYKDFIDDSKQKKEKIDTVILPKHREVLAKEREMRSAFREKADGIQKEIDAYTQRMVDQVKQFGKKTVVSLRKAEEDGLKEMDKFKVHIGKKIIELQSLSGHISANIEAKPQFSMFESINSIDLKSYQTLPNSVEFKLTDFQPQRRRFENMFGEPPVLKIEYKKKSSLSQRNAIKAFDLTTGNWLTSMDNINSDSSDEDVISTPSFKPFLHPEILSDHSISNSSDSDGVTVSSPELMKDKVNKSSVHGVSASFGQLAYRESPAMSLMGLDLNHQLAPSPKPSADQCLPMISENRRDCICCNGEASMLGQKVPSTKTHYNCSKCEVPLCLQREETVF